MIGFTPLPVASRSTRFLGWGVGRRRAIPNQPPRPDVGGSIVCDLVRLPTISNWQRESNQIVKRMMDIIERPTGTDRLPLLCVIRQWCASLQAQCLNQSISDMASSDETPVDRQAAQCNEAAPRWFGDLGQAEFELDFYERILARHPNYVIVLLALGKLLTCNGLHARSLEVHRRLVILLPHDYLAHYNLACSLARQGMTIEAIEELARAIELGYDDFGQLEVDPDLASLRKLPAYRKLVRQHGTQS
jgi:tetratricopeptide (TPR) repeat protein